MSLSSATLLNSVALSPDSPPLLHADVAADPVGWAARHHDALRAVVAEHGCVLVRGLGLADPAGTEAVFRRLTDSLMPDREPFAPRRTYAEGVYSATKWPTEPTDVPAPRVELRPGVPGLLLFACLDAPTQGGATPVADAAAVLQSLPAQLVERFEREGWLLTRTYHEEIGASVAEAFGTDDRGVVERYCRAQGIEFAWQRDGSLRTRQHRSRRDSATRSPAAAAGSTRSPSSTSGRWSPRCAST
jgi:hypothetical protein